MEGPETVSCPLRAASLASPDAPALIGSSGPLTYAKLDRRVTPASEKLAEMGLEPGDRVALYLPKDERYIVLLLATIRTGIVACPMSNRLPIAGVAPLVRKAACKALITENDELLRESDSDVQGLRPRILLEAGLDHSEPPDPLEIPLSRPATIVFTSGSSGSPKAALHTFGNHYYNALGSNENITLDSNQGDRWLHSLPLYHVGGLSILFRCLLAGATIVMPEPGAPIGQSIVEGGATHVSLVATQLQRMMREETVPLETLKAVLLGGGPVPKALVFEAASRGVPVHTSYGLTEMASQVTTTPPGTVPERLRTSGQVLPYREICISTEGEILVRGETLFVGYVEGADVDRRLDGEGWFYTGDLGTLDDGYLRVTGRRDNLFISGGENVQPEEIEESLRSLDGVEDAVIVPIPDAEFGERPVAFLRMKNGDPSAPEVSAMLETNLPRFKIPVSFHGWPDDVGQTGMKVDRAFFRDRAKLLASEDGQDVPPK